MLAAPLLVAASTGSGDPDVAAPRPSVTAEAVTVDLDALAARDEASASRGQSRPTLEPSVEPSVEPPVPVEPVAPEPEPEPSVPPPPPAPPAVTGTLWVSDAVNVRQGPSADTERIGSLEPLDQVDVTGATEADWTQVVVQDVVGWVNSNYLSETEPVLQAASPEQAAPAAALSDAPCSINPEIESNLTGNARAVYRAVCASYGGSVSAFGGLRPGDDGDHGTGRAVDVMVSGEAGWEIARFLQARAGELGISYLIYEQQYWPAGAPAGAWEWMEDRGGATANHYDHVHVSVG